MPKKPPTIVWGDKLDKLGLPPDEKAALRSQIEQMFADPDTLRDAKPVVAIGSDVSECPECGTPFRARTQHTTQLPDHVGGRLAGETVEFIDCDKCDACFMRPAAS